MSILRSQGSIVLTILHVHTSFTNIHNIIGESSYKFMSLVRKNRCVLLQCLTPRDHTSDQLVNLCSKTFNQFKRVLGLDPDLGQCVEHGFTVSG